MIGRFTSSRSSKDAQRSRPMAEMTIHNQTVMNAPVTASRPMLNECGGTTKRQETRRSPSPPARVARGEWPWSGCVGDRAPRPRCYRRAPRKRYDEKVADRHARGHDHEELQNFNASPRHRSRPRGRSPTPKGSCSRRSGRTRPASLRIGTGRGAGGSPWCEDRSPPSSRRRR
jgi:hypothetical protein